MNSIATTCLRVPNATVGEAGLLSSIRAALLRLTRPALAAPKASDPLREAAAVRAMADAVRSSDPHFAADLYAAADRHEELYAPGGAR